MAALLAVFANTTAKYFKKTKQLYKTGLSKSEIAIKLKINRTSVWWMLG